MNKKICLFIIISIFSFQVMAQKTVPLYPTVPNLKSTCDKKERIPVTGEVADVIEPTLTEFIPDKLNETKAAVLILPGGGYTHLAMEKEGFAVARKFNELGIAAFVLKYRMPLSSCFENSSFAPLQDAQQALLMIRQQAVHFGIDPNNVGVTGFSAGGHLASTLLTHADTSLVDNKGISLLPSWGVLGYPVIDMSITYSHRGSRDNLLGKNPSQETIDYFSSQKRVTKTTPPCFIFLAQDDKVVKPINSIEFYEAMIQNDVKGELHITEKGGHGFGLNNKTTKEDWFATLTDWLQQNNWLK
ncbi:MAG: alpha/beta hydrolase [Pseudopedobacter saltans]|uniref:Alpha/beta hydrolase n=1 Tax=Pseudopedobacter saltans TaxID=151895 RepID=A0A2W5H910_9SPHI|nr:MAG: alpha/beta hydrolase [Pseudopedobacter saltans]